MFWRLCYQVDRRQLSISMFTMSLWLILSLSFQRWWSRLTEVAVSNLLLGMRYGWQSKIVLGDTENFFHDIYRAILVYRDTCFASGITGGLLDNSRTNQLADSQLADKATRTQVNSRTRRLADRTTCGRVRSQTSQLADKLAHNTPDGQVVYNRLWWWYYLQWSRPTSYYFDFYIKLRFITCKIKVTALTRLYPYRPSRANCVGIFYKKLCYCRGTRDALVSRNPATYCQNISFEN